jgi:hypothetical protein
MTLLLLLLIIATAVGGFCLWISGVLFGRRARDASPSLEAHNALVASQSALADELAQLRSELTLSEGRLTETEDERGRLQTELDTLKSEADRAESELKLLRKQLDSLKKQSRRTEMLTPAKPIETSAITGAKNAADVPSTDAALADLDIERVAHQETREELDKLRQEVAELRKEEAAEGRPSVPPVPGRRGPRFQTVSIATRSEEVPAVEHDRLRVAYEQLKKDKERLETEYARTLEQLKLKNLQSSDSE